MVYRIINLEESLYDNDSIEQLGTKEKFWFYDKHDKIKKLFKIGRPGTGENWSEKTACELAKLLCLPCSHYEFAVWNGKQGVISPTFLPPHSSLVHGNELLAEVIEDYRKNQFFKVCDYKLSTVLSILRELPALDYGGNEVIQKHSDLFVGYLMFDCWISNPDRHHENWGLILDSKNKTVHLAPTYDHASGLGCRVSDKKREARLTTNDKRYNVEAFVKKAKSAFYDENLKQLKTIDAFIFSAMQNRESGRFWLNKLENLSHDEIQNIFYKVPNELISKPAIKFALKMLEENKKRLLKLKAKL